MVNELILIRHGQSAANVAFPEADARGAVEHGLSVSRDAEVPLTELGVTQAEAVGRWLAGLPADQVPEVAITSPYVRAVETWRIAAETSGLDLPAPVTDDRLVDRLLGDLEMMTRAAVERDHPDHARDVAAAGGQRLYRPPGGESFADMAVRIGGFLEDLAQKQAGRRVVVVAHDAVVLLVRYVLEELTWDEVEAVTGGGLVGNASVTRFVNRGGKLVLDGWNSVEHLTSD
jgi:2,3-bisphosphoglycerate-dependent phosphoglycerate mutase